MRLVSALFLVLLLFPLATLAQEGPCASNPGNCEEHQDQPADDCLADWDPFCEPREPGGAWEHEHGCFACVFIFFDHESGEGAYECVPAADGNGAPSRCVDSTDGCEMDGMCVVA